MRSSHAPEACITGEACITHAVRISFRKERITQKIPFVIRQKGFFAGDPYGTRTHVTAVKGRCLNLLTNGPGSGNLTRTDDNTGMNRVLYQLSYAAIFPCCRNSKMIIYEILRFVKHFLGFF